MIIKMNTIYKTNGKFSEQNAAFKGKLITIEVPFVRILIENIQNIRNSFEVMTSWYIWLQRYLPKSGLLTS